MGGFFKSKKVSVLSFVSFPSQLTINANASMSLLPDAWRNLLNDYAHLSSLVSVYITVAQLKWGKKGVLCVYGLFHVFVSNFSLFFVQNETKN